MIREEPVLGLVLRLALYATSREEGDLILPSSTVVLARHPSFYIYMTTSLYVTSAIYSHQGSLGSVCPGDFAEKKPALLSYELTTRYF
jgi:hypothetical protein